MVVREPTHAGSWYEDKKEVLAGQLDQWLTKASEEIQSAPSCRAIIAPHAGYSYSGRCAAYAYKAIAPAGVKRVFLLGPSHHYFTRRCALSKCTAYATPLGPIQVDGETYGELKSTGKFEEMAVDVDEAEHSLEMHLPYILRIMQNQPFTLVPIMVGALTPDSEAMYGQLLAKYMDDPTNLFVISSDFCHWGQRFSFTWYDRSHGAIHKSVKALDQAGMKLIEAGDTAGFTEYLSAFGNTICGRHPIGVLMHILDHSTTSFQTKFVRYEQSSECTCMSDSSVSYASAVVSCTA